ncbi:MAG: GMC family oxidoreductase [Bryobacteraceae bacterium]
MIRDARQLLPDAEIECDVCIVGSGAAGITCAIELGRAGLDVILLEAGGHRFSKKDQRNYRGAVVDPDHHGALDMYRHRRLGGTTCVWGGRCAPFDELDFQSRSYVPFSGWPVDAAQMHPFYERAHAYCDLGEYDYSTAGDAVLRKGELVPGFRADDVLTDQIWRFSMPTDFGKRYGDELTKSSNVTAYLHANALQLFSSETGECVRALECASVPGRKFQVRANDFILASGGLEVARLLLLSKAVHSNGIGNDRDLVGRFYGSHITGNCGDIQLAPGVRPIWDYERTQEGIYSRRTFRVNPDMQEREGLLNSRFILSHPLPADPSHGNSILSSMYLVKRLIGSRVPPEYSKAISAMQPLRHVYAHASNVICGVPSLAAFTATWLQKRALAERKLPSVSIFSKSNTYTLHFDGEQAPNRESRITLCDQLDDFGMSQLRVDWRYQPIDTRSIARSCEIIVDSLAAAGKAKALFRVEDLQARISENCAVGSHHIGTTRMADSPAKGVVDENCRVFGVSNLHIASSSTFATAGFANPTLTIVAFAVRLANHIREARMRSGSGLQRELMYVG